MCYASPCDLFIHSGSYYNIEASDWLVFFSDKAVQLKACENQPGGHPFQPIQISHNKTRPQNQNYESAARFYNRTTSFGQYHLF